MGTLEVSQKRIDANRKNAMRSTGPKTADGKAKSRRNSLVHGMAGSGLVLPEAETAAAAGRTLELCSTLQPANALECALVETVAAESLRIERCRLEERLARDFRARRAQHCWGDERRASIAVQARTLKKTPARTASELATSSPGCDWLTARWRMLGQALDVNGCWTEEQDELALDLLGIDPELRDQPTPIDTLEGVNPLEHCKNLVDDQVNRLLDRKEQVLDAIEDEMQEAVSLGLDVTADPALALIRRYEAASLRRLRWALGLLQKAKGQPEAPAPQPPVERTHQAPERTHQAGSNPPERSHFTPIMQAIQAQAASQPAPAERPAPAQPNTRALRKLRQAKARRRAAEARLLAC
ncbi:hypothetical protein EP7_002676 [Isosphaeraceae bacterium EP7]